MRGISFAEAYKMENPQTNSWKTDAGKARKTFMNEETHFSVMSVVSRLTPVVDL